MISREGNIIKVKRYFVVYIMIWANEIHISNSWKMHS